MLKKIGFHLGLKTKSSTTQPSKIKLTLLNHENSIQNDIRILYTSLKKW